MDSDMKAKLETLGAGFEKILEKKFLAKGKSKIEGAAGVFARTRSPYSKICPHCHAYYSLERKKAETIVKVIGKGVEKKLRTWGHSSVKGA